MAASDHDATGRPRADTAAPPDQDRNNPGAAIDAADNAGLCLALFEAWQGPIILVGDDLRVLSANPAAAADRGLTPEAMRGRDILSLIADMAPASRRDVFRRVLATGRPERFTEKRGGRVLDQTVQAVRGPAGGPTFLALAGRDVTDEAGAEAALRQSRERLAAIVRLCPAVIGLSTRDEGRYVEVNEAFVRLTGYSREETLGRTSAELNLWIDPGDRERALEDLRRAGAVLDIEARLRRKDGQALYVLYSAAYIEDGGVPSLLVMAVDITGRKIAENELRRAKEAAEAASRAKSAFLSTMSHEIRTPMNTVLGMVDVLSETPLSLEQRACLTALQSSGEGLLALLNDILELARIESGRLDLAPEVFDPARVLDGVVDMMRLQAAGKGLEPRLVPSDGLPRATLGCPSRLRQILVTLIGNAIKFTPSGTIEVGVERERAAPEATWRFFVRDTGIGIPSDKLGLVFDRFTQADSGPTRTAGGAGLGLAICQGLVTRLGGRIWVESREGQGSTFFFTMPLPEPGPAGAGRPPGAPGAPVTSDPPTPANPPGPDAIPAAAATARPGMAAAPLGRAEPGREAAFPSGRSAEDPMDRPEPGMAASSPAGHPAVGAVLRAEPDTAAWSPTGHPSAEAGAPRVLFVEDDGPNGDVFMLFLKDSPYRPTLARDGRSALDLLNRESFDVVVMDLGLPDMDGLQVTAALRALEAAEGRPRIPVVALTAHALDTFRLACAKAGCDLFLSKPISRTELLSGLARVLGKRAMEMAGHDGVRGPGAVGS